MSEQELLLLSNYAYFRCSVNGGTIGDNIRALKNDDGSFDMEKVKAQGATGDIISDEDAIDILTRIENDEKLASLELKETINDGDLRVAMYVDETGKDATVVFRGTGGTYDAWEDNVLGAYETDTSIQKRAADFIKNECKDYSNITVTGHSKGGNLSQYVTVTCSDQIDRCVSFDGQGFGKDFLNKYEDEIGDVKDKITCINGYNDFVNILLTPIGGTYLFVHNQPGIGIDMHSCYTMLSNGVFDGNGDFDRVEGVRSPATEIVLAKVVIDNIMNKVDGLPEDEREAVINLLGTYVASIFSANMSDEYEKGRIEDALMALDEIVNEEESQNKEADIKTNEPVNYKCDFLYINIDNVKQCYEQLDSLSFEIKNYPVIIEDVLVSLEMNIRGINFTEIALKKIIAKLDKNIDTINRMKEKLFEIIMCYERADSVA